MTYVLLFMSQLLDVGGTLQILISVLRHNICKDKFDYYSHFVNFNDIEMNNLQIFAAFLRK